MQDKQFWLQCDMSYSCRTPAAAHHEPATLSHAGPLGHKRNKGFWPREHSAKNQDQTPFTENCRFSAQLL